MAQTVCVLASTPDRLRWEAIAADRNRQRKNIERARVVLASIAGGPVQQIPLTVGISRPMVWRRQQRFEEGVDGRLRDKTRKPGKPPIPAETAARAAALICAAPPHQLTHWTGRAMAEAASISLRWVQRIWAADDLQPHRLRTFKRSRDPQFTDKVADIIGSTSIRRRIRWHCRLTRVGRRSGSTRSRRSIARGRGCRSRPAAAAP